MDVQINTIMAGPDGCADAGQVISLSDAEGNRLIDGGFAVLATCPGRETTMIDPTDKEHTEREEAKVRAGVKQKVKEKSPDDKVGHQPTSRARSNGL